MDYVFGILETSSIIITLELTSFSYISISRLLSNSEALTCTKNITFSRIDRLQYFKVIKEEIIRELDKLYLTDGKKKSLNYFCQFWIFHKSTQNPEH